MYTIKNLGDDNDMFPYEYGAKNTVEMREPIFEFIRGDKLQSEIRNVYKKMPIFRNADKRAFLVYFSAYLNFDIRYPRHFRIPQIKENAELRKAMDPIAEFLCLEKKQKKEWIKDKQSGQGILTNEYGDKYEGEIKKFLPNGKGIMISSDGEKYEGEFKNGKFHGFGRYISNRHKGIPVESFEEVYEGIFKNGLFHGEGTYTASIRNKSNKKFIGQWKFGRKHGRGTYYNTEGEISSVFEYKYGRQHGKATVNCKDRKVDYEFREDKKWNQTEYFPDGKILKRVKNGKYLIIKGKQILEED